jgi:hypothetical protein
MRPSAFAPLLAGVLIASCGDSATSPRPVASIALSPAEPVVVVERRLTLDATVLDAGGRVLDDRRIYWRSDDIRVAVVSIRGVVTARSPGVTTITATSEGRSASVRLTVLPVPVAEVVLTPNAATLVPSQTLALNVALRDADGLPLSGRTVTWSSSDPQVASVPPGSGLVRGVSPGTATITATSEGVSASATVTVVGPGVVRFALSAPSATRDFLVVIDGGPLGMRYQGRVDAGGGTTGAYQLTLPAGGPYRIRALATDPRPMGGHGLTHSTGQTRGIMVAPGASVEVPVALQPYSVVIVAPDTVQRGERVTVRWRYTDPGDVLLDGLPLRRPGGAVLWAARAFEDTEVVSRANSTEVFTGTELVITASFIAPQAGDRLYFQVEGYTFASTFHQTTTFPYVARMLDPSTTRGEGLRTIVVR